MAYSKNFSIEELRFDNNGLIPAIAQDWLDGSILMLAWMNKESLNKHSKQEMYITGVDLDPRYGEKEQRAEVPNFLKKLDLIAIMMHLFFR